MRGRPGKPIGLHILEGNPNRLTKAEIEQRQANEIKLGNQHFEEPVIVRRDKVAHQTWLEIMACKESADADWITSADTKLLEMICMVTSELADLEATRREFKKQVKKNKIDLLKATNLDNKLQLDTKINKKRMLLKSMLADIYWTPISRYKNIPKKQKPAEETPLQKAGFGYV